MRVADDINASKVGNLKGQAKQTAALGKFAIFFFT